MIRHLLSQIPYEDVPREKIKLPKRQIKGDSHPSHACKFVPEVF